MKQLVVGFADIDTAKVAVKEAANLAKALGASLHVVTALESDDTEVVRVGSDEWQLSDSDAAISVIRDYMSSLKVGVDYTIGVLRGAPADVLLAEAERLNADLIVVGNVRMQGIGRVLGSVGSGVVHHAPCSVLIVKTS
ncbi:MAG: universal stress protein [Acidimicrobiia bacterium]